MKLQVDVTVNSPEHAYEVLDNIKHDLASGRVDGVANDYEGTPVGQFELLQPQENESAC
jgi:hypothetical protein